MSLRSEGLQLQWCHLNVGILFGDPKNKPLRSGIINNKRKTQSVVQLGVTFHRSLRNNTNWQNIMCLNFFLHNKKGENSDIVMPATCGIWYITKSEAVNIKGND